MSTSALSVDIVITNHDYARFLPPAIESALAQTHSDVQVVVVDDGSTDGSREVLSGYEDRVEVVLQERGGQAAALNAGVERCRGEVLMLLDADDVLRPHAAERVAAAFAARPELSKVQFPMAIVDADGTPTGAVKPGGHLRAPVGDQRRAELAFPFDLPWLPGGGTGFRMDAVRRILPIPARDYPRSGADWYLVHLTALIGEAALLDEVCAEYRVHGGNAYELENDEIDLDHVRESIVFAGATTRSLEALADELGLERPGRVLSCADLANRLVSLRLEPERHPVAGDRRRSLLLDAFRATRRRFDVSLPMKALLVAWFALEALAPRRLARPLAELFLFPGRRSTFNRVLGRLQRRRGGDGTVEPT
ncbi:MAG TPA: glycosyltransferase family A protein [Solirubrobacterales bacterium]|nr:glycosyltransferase family A protein [Solirubrobacterales bacterium]